MGKGVKKIQCVGGKIYPKRSVLNKSLVVPPNEDILFDVKEWGAHTTEIDKKKNLTWIWQTSDTARNIIGQLSVPSSMRFKFKLPKKLCGPYTYYIEASWSGKRDFKNHTGLYVKGSCPSKVIITKWCTSMDGKDERNKLFNYGDKIFLSVSTEGLNGSLLTVEIYRIVSGDLSGSKKDDIIKIIPNVPVIDGEINVEVEGTSLWPGKINKIEDQEQFYVKIKDAFGNYIQDDNNDTCHARFLKIKKEVVKEVPKKPENKTVAKVGSVNVNHSKPFLCNYESIILEDADSDKNKFEKELYNSKKNKVIPTYETIAGAEESSKKTINFKFLKIATNQCVSTVKHKKEVEIFINGKKQKTEVIANEKVAVNLIADANLALLRVSPEVFFLSPDKISKYQIIAKTCGQPSGVININVYPNVEREIAFVLTLLKSYSRENNNKVSQQESLIEYNKEKSLKLVRDIKETLIQTKGGFGVSLQAKVKVDNTESSIELAKTRGQIKKLIDFHYTVTEILSQFDGSKASGTPDKYTLRKGIKWTFDIEPPNVALALRMTNKKIQNTNEVVRQFIGGLALKPIVKFKFGVDILSLLQYFGVGGKIADWIKNVVERKFSFTLYLIIEASLEAKTELTLNYNRIEGFAPGKRKLEVETALAVKGGAKSVGKDNFVTVVVPEADGKLQKVQVEKWKAEVTATAGIMYTYEIHADQKGQYSQHKLEFSGLKATIIVYSIRQGMQYNESLKKEFSIIPKPQDPWYKSDKEYFI